jgi:hypothetical protein
MGEGRKGEGEMPVREEGESGEKKKGGRERGGGGGERKRREREVEGQKRMAKPR